MIGGRVVFHYLRALAEWRDFLTVIRLLQYRILEEKPALRAVLEAVQRSSATL